MKVYCKKTYYSYSTDEFNTDIKEEWTTEGKEYEIIHVENFEIAYIIDNDGDSNSTLTVPNIFNEYFYTEKEYRKLKLEKLTKHDEDLLP